MPAQTRKTTHFRGLTEIRGIAATAVLLSHLDQYHFLFGTPHLGLSETGIADHAVTIFFVLSGFLITFLLLQEREDSGNVAVGGFYMRRILRIWPVYYIAFACAMLLAWSGFTEWPEKAAMAALMMGLMLPNLAYAMEMVFRAATPLWSVGVEEQFYLVWPWIVRKRSSLLTVLIGIILVLVLLRVTLAFVRPDGGLFALLRLTRIDCMAVGGILAWIAHKAHPRARSFLGKPVMQVLGILLIVMPLITYDALDALLGMHAVTIGAGIIIYNSAVNERAWVRPNSVILRWLGTISYGIYAYHLLVIFLLHRWLQEMPLWAVAPIVIATTIFFAFLSYKLIELRALELKSRYTIVPSKALKEER